MTAQWLSEPDRQTELPWFFDAPWEVANQRDSHKYAVRGAGAAGFLTVFYAVSMLARCGREPLRQVLYGNSQFNPGEMMGLTPCYNTRDPKQAANSVNVLDAGGTDNLCSAWLLGWGPRTIYMASADGEPCGIGSECCLVIADWRYAVRVANIDAVSPNFDALAMLSRAALRFPRLTQDENLRPIFYVNRDVENRLKDGIPALGNGQEYVARFRGIPVRVIDELRSDEARV